MKWKLTESNPFEEVEISRGAEKKERDMSFEGVLKLLQTIDNSGNFRFGIYVRFLLYTGCRRSEILFLRFENINLDSLSLKINAEKTRKEMVLPINKALKRVMDNLELKEKGFVFQTDSKSRGAHKKEQPWHPAFVTHKFKYYADKAGLSGFTLHSLRHTYATYLLKKGVPLDIVQKLLGHASPRVTSENYDHSVALHFREQADLVDFEEGNEK